MERSLFVALVVAAAALPDSGAAQDVRIYGAEPGARAFAFVTGDENRAVIGVSTATGSARDTLGVLVTAVTPGGPAERAGIEEGNRIAAVNGVNLRLSPADVGDWEMASAMSRRLSRELGKAKPGDEVELRVYSSGNTRTVRIRTVAADSLYPSRRFRNALDDRAALGISLGRTGSARDTLGVLIMGIEDDGPAAKAGLEEGNRIASINGVDLRVAPPDAGDEFLGSAKASRLHRELAKVKPGDDVTLRVYTGAGRFREVRVKTVPHSELPRRRTTIFGGSALPSRAPTAPMPPFHMEFRRDFEQELDRAGRRIERMVPRVLNGLTRVTI